MRFPAELTVTIPRRWAWALGIGMGLLGGMLVWLLLAAHGAAPAVVAAVQGAAQAVERRVMGPVPLRLAPPAVRESAASHGADEYELCAGTWVKANADGQPDAADMARAVRRDDLMRTIADKLDADPRPQARAARLWLQMQSTGAVVAVAVADARNSLARLAIGTPDPATYALAFHTCGSGRVRDGDCALLSAEQWARLDPGNAAPWQEVFAAAQQRRDTASANEALHRIATSQRSELRMFDLLRMILEVAPDDDASQNGVFMLAGQVFGVQAAWPFPAYQPLVSACRQDMLRDSNRRQTCEAIAELLAQKSDTSIERGIGISLGGQLGWPAERTERMRAEQMAYSSSAHVAIEARDAMSCAAVRRSNEQVRRVARLGETGALRDWLAHEAPPPDELVRRYRSQMTELAKATAAAQAASAASAPR